jgi:hypothetical protein
MPSGNGQSSSSSTPSGRRLHAPDRRFIARRCSGRTPSRPQPSSVAHVELRPNKAVLPRCCLCLYGRSGSRRDRRDVQHPVDEFATLLPPPPVRDRRTRPSTASYWFAASIAVVSLGAGLAWASRRSSTCARAPMRSRGRPSPESSRCTYQHRPAGWCTTRATAKVLPSWPP